LRSGSSIKLTIRHDSRQEATFLILTAPASGSPAQWHAGVHAHILPVEVGAPIVAVLGAGAGERPRVGHSDGQPLGVVT
jgi:hypothetical protein